MATYILNNDPQRQPDSKAWSIESGWQTVKTWEGTKEACEALAVALTSDGATSLSIQGDGATFTLKATYQDAQDSTIDDQASVQNVTWELMGNELEKSLRTHPTIFNPTTGTDAQRKDLNEADTYITNGTAINSGWYAGAQSYFKLRSMGVESYIVAQYVLRKSIKVGIASDVAASLTNVNKVESPAFNDGITKLFSLPTEFASGSGSLEWLKRTPTIVSLGRGKYSIAQDWWASHKWSSLLYGGTSIP